MKPLQNRETRYRVMTRIEGAVRKKLIKRKDLECIRYLYWKNLEYFENIWIIYLDFFAIFLNFWNILEKLFGSQK